MVPGDSAGSRVLAHLAGEVLPPGVDLVDGGLGGLNLLGLLDGVERVVFVDSVRGLATEDGVVTLDLPQVLEAIEPEPAYGHANGLAYLLRVLPVAGPRPLPCIHLVGVEAPVGAVPGDGLIESAAAAALRLVAAATEAP